MSSESWKADPTISPYWLSASTTSVGRTAEHGAVAGRRRDQRAGLAGDDLEVVRERVLAGSRLDGLEDLPLDQAGECLGLDAYGVRAEVGGQLGGLPEEEVAGEDRDVVVPACVGGVGAAAQGRLVHDVVVVEGRHVGELDDARRGQDLGGVRLRASLGRQQHQQRAEALAARGHQVRGRGGDVVRAPAAVTDELLLDHGEAPGEAPLQLFVDDGESQVRGREGGHLMNSPASPARSSIGPGMTPRTRVTAAPIAIVVAVRTDG